MTQTQAVEVAQPEALYDDDTYSDFSGDNSECHEPENVTAEKILLADNISKNEGEIIAMLNKYAENRATRRAILDGVRFFRREIQKRTEKGLSSEKLPDAILSVKEEYRRLRLEGFQLRRKLLRVICAEEISQACAKYVARCCEIQRRHTGK